MIVTHRERERGRDTGRGRSRLHAPGAQRGTRSQVSRITPWAEGGAKLLSHPGCPRSLTSHLPYISDGPVEFMITLSREKMKFS